MSSCCYRFVNHSLTDLRGRTSRLVKTMFWKATSNRLAAACSLFPHQKSSVPPCLEEKYFPVAARRKFDGTTDWVIGPVARNSPHWGASGEAVTPFLFCLWRHLSKTVEAEWRFFCLSEIFFANQRGYYFNFASSSIFDLLPLIHFFIHYPSICKHTKKFWPVILSTVYHIIFIHRPICHHFPKGMHTLELPGKLTLFRLPVINI